MVADWAAAISAAVAAIGLVFAGWQLRILNQQARYERRVAQDGVVVSWRSKAAPDHAESNGMADWIYEIIAHNPSRLPIDDIKVEWRFGGQVQHVHYSGKVDSPTDVLVLGAAVLAGNQAQKWDRRLRIRYEDRARILHPAQATITFTNIDGVRTKNTWPRRPVELKNGN
jgi:hypothetical protein